MTDPLKPPCATKDELGEVHERLDRGKKRLDRLEDALTENTKLTQQVVTQTAELIAFFNAMRGAFKVLNWLGKLAKPMAAIVALCAALMGLWASVKGGLLR